MKIKIFSDVLIMKPLSDTYKSITKDSTKHHKNKLKSIT